MIKVGEKLFFVLVETITERKYVGRLNICLRSAADHPGPSPDVGESELDDGGTYLTDMGHVKVANTFFYFFFCQQLIGIEYLVHNEILVMMDSRMAKSALALATNRRKGERKPKQSSQDNGGIMMALVRSRAKVMPRHFFLSK